MALNPKITSAIEFAQALDTLRRSGCPNPHQVLVRASRAVADRLQAAGFSRDAVNALRPRMTIIAATSKSRDWIGQEERYQRRIEMLWAEMLLIWLPELPSRLKCIKYYHAAVAPELARLGLDPGQLNQVPQIEPSRKWTPAPPAPLPTVETMLHPPPNFTHPHPDRIKSNKPAAAQMREDGRRVRRLSWA